MSDEGLIKAESAISSLVKALKRFYGVDDEGHLYMEIKDFCEEYKLDYNKLRRTWNLLVPEQLAQAICLEVEPTVPKASLKQILVDFVEGKRKF